MDCGLCKHRKAYFGSVIYRGLSDLYERRMPGDVESREEKQIGSERGGTDTA